MIDWPEIERLCRTTEMTFGALAKQFQVSRNAIIGRSHRNGWRSKLTAEQVRVSNRIGGKASGQARAAHMLAQAGKVAKPPKLEVIAAIERAPPAGARGISVAQLTLNTCRWPIGSVRGAEQVFCGRWCDEDKPYCKTCVREHRPFQPKQAKSSRNDLVRSLRRYL